ncbi:methyl-accepting chemotaxis protein [Clostridium intestinale]|uniref:Methyl-accepting chemotaxis sensory transducer n=1 Tax=Clostridium intestinale DSM 6191 TaxID=1121320 RepID=A0A1M5YEU6_9CLOT|nr:methyl-accepting chemotaxis protein [Clostridium intestinale]SHI10429.1 methyl-accepting chemotaxis sensory transducer [Clostridium intestinale DSM 6191]
MDFFKNVKLTQKISLLSISFLIFLTIIGVTSVKQLTVLNNKIMELNEQRVAPIIKLENIKSDIEYIRYEGNSLMDASDDDEKKTIKDAIATKVSDIDEALLEYKDDEDFSSLFSNYDAFIAAKDTFVENAEQRGLIQQNGAHLEGQIPPESQDGAGGAPNNMQAFDEAKIALVESFDEVINNHVLEAQNTYQDSKADYKKTVMILISIVVICIVISLLLSIVIIRLIIVPVKKVTGKLKEVSESNGDLTQRINYESKDEIGQLSKSFDLFMDKLQSIIKEVASSAEVIESSSGQLSKATAITTESLEEISKTVVDISGGASDGAASAEETTAGLSEAARFSEAASDASRKTAYNSKKVKESAEDGANKIDEIVSSITNIASSSKEVSVIINELDYSSRKIGDIIKIITSISEQTNLLALNAAIEAARAGEAGKGFNVVSDEIRKLADESSKAARDIYELVKDNQLKSASAVTSVNQVEERVAKGVEKASEVGESIQNIIKNVNEIVVEIEQIDKANVQQVESTKEIEQAINNIALSSNEIASGTENISSSIEEQLKTMNGIEKTTEDLLEMSRRLSKITSGFKV